MIYKPRCIVAFDAQQKHNISSFFNFASVILKIFRFFRVFLEKSGVIGGQIAENSGDKTGGRLAAGAMQSASWSETGVRTDTDGYGHQRTSTDDKPAGALR